MVDHSHHHDDHDHHEFDPDARPPYIQLSILIAMVIIGIALVIYFF